MTDYKNLSKDFNTLCCKIVESSVVAIDTDLIEFSVASVHKTTNVSLLEISNIHTSERSDDIKVFVKQGDWIIKLNRDDTSANNSHRESLDTKNRDCFYKIDVPAIQCAVLKELQQYKLSKKVNVNLETNDLNQCFIAFTMNGNNKNQRGSLQNLFANQYDAEQNNVVVRVHVDSDLFQCYRDSRTVDLEMMISKKTSVSETSTQYSKRKQKDFQSKIITPFMKRFIASFYLKLIQLMSEAGKLCNGKQNGNANRNGATSPNRRNYNENNRNTADQSPSSHHDDCVTYLPMTCMFELIGQASVEIVAGVIGALVASS